MVHVARMSSIWSALPLTAFQLVIVVENKKLCFIVSDATMDEVNDKYVFYKVVESTVDNYRNVMYMKHPTPGMQESRSI